MFSSLNYKLCSSSFWNEKLIGCFNNFCWTCQIRDEVSLSLSLFAMFSNIIAFVVVTFERSLKFSNRRCNQLKEKIPSCTVFKLGIIPVFCTFSTISSPEWTFALIVFKGILRLEIVLFNWFNVTTFNDALSIGLLNFVKEFVLSFLVWVDKITIVLIAIIKNMKTFVIEREFIVKMLPKIHFPFCYLLFAISIRLLFVSIRFAILWNIKSKSEKWKSERTKLVLKQFQWKYLIYW